MSTVCKKAVVLHSGGMDSSICLALAIQKWGKEHVMSLSILYGQRHAVELLHAARICRDWGVDHHQISLNCLSDITDNALTNHNRPIIQPGSGPPNTLVTGRNGLMAQFGGIYANYLQADWLYLGIIGVESANSGYRDCSREYMDLVQQLLRIDLNQSDFVICTPLVNMSKKETLKLAYELGVLEYLLTETVSCYQGIPLKGCEQCPSCQLRNQGIKEFMEENPHFSLDYLNDVGETL